jgi:hypothetical protein
LEESSFPDDTTSFSIDLFITLNLGAVKPIGVELKYFLLAFLIIFKITDAFLGFPISVLGE